jgi:pimeloyl-ACP methyl ester carboxylesterase
MPKTSVSLQISSFAEGDQGSGTRDVWAAADWCVDRSVLVGLQRRLIYLPFPAQVPRAEAVVAGARELTLRTVDGLALGAWLVEAGQPDRGVAVLVANGNAGNRSLRAPLARALASAGLAVLLFDYRGYGGNPGRPSEQGLARDVRAAHRFLIEEAEVTPARLHPLADQLARVKVPTTVVYGSRDSIVPPEQSRAVAAVAAGETRIVEIAGADHNDLALLDGEKLIEAVVELAERVCEPPTRRAGGTPPPA